MKEKRIKCKYCKAYMKNHEWLTKDEDKTCFSCRLCKGLIETTAQSLYQLETTNISKASRKLWAKKVFAMLLIPHHDLPNIPF